MKILVTGAKGFIGRNLIAQLKNIQDGKVLNTSLNDKLEIVEFDRDTDVSLLAHYTKDCDFVFHLAGVNRPQNTIEFMEGNFGFTKILLESLKKHNNKAPILITSSIQASLDNPYGESKKAGEELLLEYNKETNAKTLIYRLPNVFGKWCKPNYNSAIATFCHNITRDLNISVNDRDAIMNLVYIDDVVSEFIKALQGKEHIENGFGYIPTVHRVSLGDIVDNLYSFKAMRENLDLPDMSDAFVKSLYSTYISYLPSDKFSYPLKMNIDQRGSFTEIIKTQQKGQFSVNISKPGITKGNHWHHTKNEKFVVVSGKGVIRFRKINEVEITEYYVCEDKIEVIDIPCGYTHNITNLGDTDLVTFMWCNECFDSNYPDTYFEEV
ncbi:MAG: capsular polysaccharide biosynthesis protein CapF [Anaerorhabdus sp.]|uniref:capsular polysaccharide biosynthesis protein CapF n=1 Tax=Anaerorhabdus sp. TaxID=1872524 RepID=UPI002FC800C1